MPRTLGDIMANQRFRKQVRTQTGIQNPTFQMFDQHRQQQRDLREQQNLMQPPAAPQPVDNTLPDLGGLSPDRLTEILRENAESARTGGARFNPEQIRSLIRQRHIARNLAKKNENALQPAVGGSSPASPSDSSDPNLRGPFRDISATDTFRGNPFTQEQLDVANSIGLKVNDSGFFNQAISHVAFGQPRSSQPDGSHLPSPQEATQTQEDQGRMVLGPNGQRLRLPPEAKYPKSLRPKFTLGR